MSYLLTISLWLLPLSRLLTSKLYGFLYFLTALSLTPRYLGIGVGVDGMALTANRLLIFSFAGIAVFSLIQAGATVKLRPELKWFFYGLIFLNIYSCLGTFEYGSWLFSLLYLLENLCILVLCYVIGVRLAIEKNGLTLLYKYAFSVPIMLCTFLVTIELLRRAPLVAGFFDVDSTIATSKDFYTDFTVRDGTYRARALFNGPLQLGEFCVYCFTLGFTLFVFNAMNRKLLLIAMVCSLYVAWASDTRSSLLIMSITSAAIVFALIFKKSSVLGKYFTWIVGITCGILSFVALSILFGQFQDVVLLNEIDIASERSTAARVLQIRAVSDLASESAFYGYGYQRNFVLLFDSLFSLDSYYFKVLLQSGYVGLIVLILSLLRIFSLFVKTTFSGKKQKSTYGLLGFSLFVGFILYKFFLSGDSNNIYIYTLVTFIVTRISMLEGRSRN